MAKGKATRWLLAGAAVIAAVAAFTPDRTWAAGDPPPGEKPRPKPKGKNSSLNQDQVYSLGYWQAKTGDYSTALATLQSAPDQSDPRVQTMVGFTLRKQGRVNEAFSYYLRALAIRPDATTTRQYLGEAYLQIGDVVGARQQLAEIAKRCGTACEDYTALAEEIARHTG